jgi:hypothetical protein
MFELKGELQDYFQETVSQIFQCFEDEEWLEKRVYLADISSHEPVEQASSRSQRKCFDFK